MADNESGGADVNVGVREHLDNPIVFVILIVLAVCALQGVGRAIGNKAGAPGVTAFFGG